MTLPFSEGFENNGSMPFCWTLWEHSSYTNYGYTYSYPQIYSYNSHGGNYCIDMYSDYGPNSIISPRVLIPANQIEVTFWAYGNYGYIQVGYTTSDDSATAVFHPVGEVQLSSEYELYTVSFDTIASTNSVYVAFRVANTQSFFSLKLVYRGDDLVAAKLDGHPLDI